MTMADGWGYHYDDVYKSSRQLIHLLIDVVAKGGNLALNVGPVPDGRLPRPAIERMEEMGRWLAKNGEAIYSTRAVKPYKLGKWCFTRGKDDLTYAIRLWGEGENPRTGILLNLEKAHPEVTKVTHLATGWKMSFEKTVGDYEQGVHLEFPEGFARDEFADAFCVEYKRDVGRTFNESTSKLKN